MEQTTVCHYGAGNKTMRGVINGAGNRLQTVCQCGAGNKTMRGVSVSMGLGTDYKEPVIMGLETRL